MYKRKIWKICAYYCAPLYLCHWFYCLLQVYHDIPENSINESRTKFFNISLYKNLWTHEEKETRIFLNIILIIKLQNILYIKNDIYFLILYIIYKLDVRKKRENIKN